MEEHQPRSDEQWEATDVKVGLFTYTQILKSIWILVAQKLPFISLVNADIMHVFCVFSKFRCFCLVELVLHAFILSGSQI